MKLGISISRTVGALAAADELDVDYIVWYGQLGVEGLADLVQSKPILLHDLADSFWLNYADPFDAQVMRVARAMLDITRSPWLSTGIGASAEPQAHRQGPYREADDAQRQQRTVVIDNITQHGRRLAAWAGIPLLLENFNYHPTNAYEYICEPDVFSGLLEAIGCEMLLDLAHARISAHNMREWGGDTAAYLSALPLNKVREIHFSRPGWQREEYVDLHQPVCSDDLDWLGWLLERAPQVEAITLETEGTDRTTMLAQIALMRRFLTGK